MAHLKFMQIHSFYDRALSKLYVPDPRLKERPFAEQMDLIFRDGFSAAHIFAPYMERLGYASKLVIGNCLSAQTKWWRETKGTDIPDDWVYEIALQQVEAFRPDILHLSHPTTFDSKFVRALSYRPKLVMGWRSATIPEGTDWSDFDLILSFHELVLRRALEMGVKSTEWFAPAFPRWIYEQVQGVAPSADVTFSGSWLDVHQRRNGYLQAIARETRQKDSFSVNLFIDRPNEELPEEIAPLNRGGRFGMDMYRALRSGRMVFNGGGDVYAGQGGQDLSKGDSVNMRLFEATGCGVMLLAEHHPHLERYFRVGEEIETFRDEAELLEKVRFYQKHPAALERIAHAGQERCMRDHSMDRRIVELDGIIKKYLS
ncbi:glycosyltransferase [Heliobacterium undosum]|uniref:Glycosyltransferase n=1 Tax=Heliomicrobium undosum TaxID=121734 RepID=A0A845KZG6_9FIRM|nr:glycosyltransferase [Heliomicrobium undosum]MZP29457.1 glycosyltransferase [Heliomicrobium undosum]